MSLVLDDNFDEAIDLPENITHLTFGGCFNRRINLPKNLTHLTFGYRFNKKINFPIKSNTKN